MPVPPPPWFPADEPGAVTPYCPTRSEVIKPLDIYVDAVDGDDQNDGSQAHPLATLDELLRRLQILARVNQNAPVRCHFGSGTYAWTRTLGPTALASPIAFIGDGAGRPGDDGTTNLLDPTAATAGSTNAATVGTASWTVDEWVDATIEILTGPAAGDRRTIVANSATSITPSTAFSAAVAAGNLFRIFVPTVFITPPASTSPIFLSTPAISGVGAPQVIFPGASSWTPSPQACLLVNLTFTLDDATTARQLSICDSAVQFYGVRCQSLAGSLQLLADCDSQVQAGVDGRFNAGAPRAVIPAALGLAPSATAWVGWGLSCVYAPAVADIQAVNFAGFLNYYSQRVTTGGGVWTGVQWTLLGGCFRSIIVNANFNGAFSFRGGSQVVCRGNATATPVRWQATGGEARAACVRAVGGSRLGFQNTTIEITLAGSVVAAHGPESGNSLFIEGGTISLLSGVTLTLDAACRQHAVAMGGGRVYFDNTPTVVGTPVVNQCVITLNSTGGAAIADSTFAALTDGLLIFNPDGSGTLIGRNT